MTANSLTSSQGENTGIPDARRVTVLIGGGKWDGTPLQNAICGTQINWNMKNSTHTIFSVQLSLFSLNNQPTVTG